MIVFPNNEIPYMLFLACDCVALLNHMCDSAGSVPACAGMHWWVLAWLVGLSLIALVAVALVLFAAGDAWGLGAGLCVMSRFRQIISCLSYHKP
jgi:hypothetical protein